MSMNMGMNRSRIRRWRRLVVHIGIMRGKGLKIGIVGAMLFGDLLKKIKVVTVVALA